MVKQNATTGNPRTMTRNGGRAHPMYSGAPRPDKLAANQYTLAQWNFSMFWGLAIQAYEATLVADETPFDRFQGSVGPRTSRATRRRSLNRSATA